MIHLHVEPWDGKAQANTELEEGSPAQLNVPHQLDGYIKDLLSECSENLKSLVTRLEKEIIRLDGAKRQKRGFIQMVCNRFCRTTCAVQLFLGAGQLEELISATKRVESSLGVTLTGLLCC